MVISSTKVPRLHGAVFAGTDVTETGLVGTGVLLGMGVFVAGIEIGLVAAKVWEFPPLALRVKRDSTV